MNNRKQQLNRDKEKVPESDENDIVCKLPVKSVDEMNNLNSLLTRDLIARKQFVSRF